MNFNSTTREQWLEEAIVTLKNTIFKEHDVPDILVSVGFPSRRALSSKNRVIGQCFNKVASGDKSTYHIFIHPALASGIEVLEVLVHEIIHTLLPMKTGHKAPFVKIMKAIGLEGKPTATHAGEGLKVCLAQMVKVNLGEFPHIKLDAGSQIKKQTTRMLKVMCPGCECIVRMTAKWLLEAGTPTCGCGTEMFWDEGA